jgi:hypothetical protein
MKDIAMTRDNLLKKSRFVKYHREKSAQTADPAEIHVSDASGPGDRP